MVLSVLVSACNTFPSASKQNTVGGASISSVTQIPMSAHTKTMTLEPLTRPTDGQFAIADILTYAGERPTTTTPPGWKVIRDDSAGSVHQSIYSHIVQANDPGSTVWTFDRAMNAQATIILLDNVEPNAPVDVTNASIGGPGISTKSMMTSSDGDLILVFFATDFMGTGLGPELPADMIALADQEAKPYEYWILGTYQATKGQTAPVRCPSGQLYSMVATQISIRRKRPSASSPSG